ncbi:PEP-CTERM sorting domain-containing protein [Akkermansia muciniphila]|uniref:PEP-CTERM sorting domain-containing protein n=5 Tax=Akkermansia TaxID=239934 RepID=UPI00117841A7|nr:PEP-CTERM sorting domain-containing protein [Akkermansia muciniphila]
MKKSLFLLMSAALLGSASASSVSWTGGAGTENWTDAANWDTNAVPGNGDTISISGASVNWEKTGGSIFGNSSTIFNLTDGATVSLGNLTPSSSIPSRNPRFDGQFNVGEGSVLNVNALFAYGTSRIDGTVNVYNIFDPGANHSMVFGVHGVINYMSGSMNGVEGNNRTTTISASLNTGIVTATSTYGLEKRYLICGAEEEAFNTNLYQTWNLAAGTITGTDGGALTSTEGELTATAEDFGKYHLGTDEKGVYVQYVAVVPEPATASLSLLGLTALMMRRRRLA